ncbi:MAG: BrnT family toxin, partial [Anaerolineales bacterium]|nr:BrnT family toxin [Anaerolineales bacterium]
MSYSWDEVKRESNLQKHRLDFRDAQLVFAGLTLTFEDDRFEYGEQRFITIGLLSGEFVVIAHAEESEETTR